MTPEEATGLIAKANKIIGSEPEIWADLGCGTGTFTRALAGLIPTGSTLWAIDRSRQNIPSTADVSIQFQQLDFERGTAAIPPIDGALLANSLHYVQDKKAFLRRLQARFRGPARLILVEYDTRQANPWVPYPIERQRATELFLGLGYERVELLGERLSIYGRGVMYALGVW